MPPSALREKLGGSVKPRHFSDTFARRQLKHCLTLSFLPTRALVREGKCVIATRIIFFSHTVNGYSRWDALMTTKKLLNHGSAPQCERFDL